MQHSVTVEQQATPQVSTWAPPRFLNRVMIWLLRMPLLERWIGKEIALISFRGRKSGKLYTTPVTYRRDGDDVVILTKHFRRWWRNLKVNPKVVLRLAGRNVPGVVTVMASDDAAAATMLRFLAARRRDAPAYGLHFDKDGQLDPELVRAMLPQVIVLRVTPVPDELAQSLGQT